MSDQSTNSPETGPNAPAMRQTAADERQTLLNLAPDMPPAGEPDHGRARRQRRDGLRADGRRTAEYLASRGRTVVEVMHDLVRLGAIEGPLRISKELGVSKPQAMDYWRAIAESLLPYTAHKLESIDASSAGAAGAAGGMAAMHFLAARAAGDRILAGHASSAESPISRIGDRGSAQDLTGIADGGTVMDRRQPLVVLPPIGED
jgi:hypothetical protein